MGEILCGADLIGRNPYGYDAENCSVQKSSNMKIYQYFVSLCRQLTRCGAGERKSGVPGDMSPTIIAVGNGGCNIVSELRQRGCLHDATYWACDTSAKDLAQHADCVDKTFLLERIVGTVKAADVRSIRRMVKQASNRLVLVGTLGGQTGSKYLPLLALGAVLRGRTVYAVVARPLDCEGPLTHDLAEKAMRKLAASSSMTLVLENQALTQIPNLPFHHMNRPLVETVSAVCAKKPFQKQTDCRIRDLQKLIPEPYRIGIERTDRDGTHIRPLLSFVCEMKHLSKRERKRLFDL